MGASVEGETESVAAGCLVHRHGEDCANGSDLAPAEAAVELRCSRTLVYRLIERGELPGTYELPGSNRKRIPRADLDALKERQRVGRAASRPIYEPHMVPAGRPRSASFTAELDALERGGPA